MEQIAVTKITTDGRGHKSSRNMHLPKNIWEDIVKHNGSGEANVEWKLRAEIPVSSVQTIVIAPPVKSEVTEVFGAEEKEFIKDLVKLESPEKVEKRKSKKKW